MGLQPCGVSDAGDKSHNMQVQLRHAFMLLGTLIRLSSYNANHSLAFSRSRGIGAAFAACAVSPIWDIACFGCIASVMIFCDYILVITWLPAAIIVHEKYMINWCPWCTPSHAFSYVQAMVCSVRNRSDPTPDADNTTAATNTTTINSNSAVRSTNAATTNASVEDSTNESPKPRFLEHFFGGIYSDILINNARSIVVFFVCLFIVSVTVAATCVEPARKQTDFFEDNHFYAKARDTSAEKFGFTASEEVEQITASFSFGLKHNDPWSQEKVHPCDIEDEDEFLDTKVCLNRKTITQNPIACQLYFLTSL